MYHEENNGLNDLKWRIYLFYLSYKRSASECYTVTKSTKLVNIEQLLLKETQVSVSL